MIRFNNSISILFLSVVLLFVSCGKDNDVVPEEPATPAITQEEPESLSALIDGQLFEAHSLTCDINFEDRIYVLGSNVSSVVNMLIQMPKDITPGSYNIGESSVPTIEAGYDSNSVNAMVLSDSGVLIITKHDVVNKVIEGTFDFEIPISNSENMNSISEGAFRGIYE